MNTATSNQTGWPRLTAAGLASVVLLLLLLAPSASHAETKVGGHFGFVLPLVSQFDGETTDIGDDFTIGFPTGITVRTSDRLAFDLEFVPVIQDEPSSIADVVVHPGVLYGFNDKYTGGVRMAFEVDGEAWGFTPLIARGFPIEGQNATYFIELDFPIRVKEDSTGSNDISFGVAFHTGIGF